MKDDFLKKFIQDYVPNEDSTVKTVRNTILKELFGSMADYKKMSKFYEGFDIKYTPVIYREPTLEEAIDWAEDFIDDEYFDDEHIESQSEEIKAAVSDGMSPGQVLRVMGFDDFHTSPELSLLFNGKTLYYFVPSEEEYNEQECLDSECYDGLWQLKDFDEELYNSIIDILPFSLMDVCFDEHFKHPEEYGIIYTSREILSYWSRVMFSRINRSFVSSARAKVRRNARKVAMYRRFVAKSPVGGRAVAENKRKK